MIPKIIHLCWLSGDPYPEKIAKCISTWKKHLPDYEIMLWDTNRFDVNSTLWTRQAFEAKKYAFVSDYIRFYAVFNYGGIYLDSDVELLKSFNDLLDLPYFVGREANNEYLEVAAFGAEKGNKWVKSCLDWYDNRPFINEDGSLKTIPCPSILTSFLKEKFVLKSISSIQEFSSDMQSICIFPNCFFCSHQLLQHTSRKSTLEYSVTSESYCVHHFANTWIPFDKKSRGLLHRIYAKLFHKDPRYLGREMKDFN